LGKRYLILARVLGYRKIELKCKFFSEEEEQIDFPLVLVEGKDHGTIMSQPDPFLVDRVLSALKVSTE
jgi:hypothetical protein